MRWDPQRTFRSLLCATATTAVLASPAAAAPTVSVTTTGDPGPGGTVSLRQAIAAVDPGGTIVVPAGMYVLAAGQLVIAKSLSITGAGATTTTISAGGAGRVFSLTGAGATAISGVTITGGHVTTPGGVEQGGGVLADAGSPLTLSGVRVAGNEVDVSGTSGPGGIANGGGIATQSDLTLIGTTVTANAVRARGAAAKPGGIVRGGGIASLGNDTTTVSLTDSAVDQSTADVTGGAGAAGGIVEGGGIHVANAPLTLMRAAVTRSSAVARATGAGAGGIAEGGGIFAGGALSVTNVTISENSVDASAASAAGGIAKGGGAYAESTTTITHATLNANGALAPGSPVGIAAGGNIQPGTGTVTVTGSIVAGGVAGAGDENCADPLTSGGHNLESLDQCGFAAAGDLTGKDPLLGPLQDNGGPSLTHALPPTSPAIDAAASASCPATDQRGVTRPQLAGCDVGAFERAADPPPTTPPVTSPPASAPTTPAATRSRTPVFGTGGIVVGAPRAGRCLSRRAFTIRIRKLPGVTITSAAVYVNGRRVAVRRGLRLTAPVNLRNLPKGRYAVRIVVKLADGSTLSGTRRYRTCTRKRKAGKRIGL